MTTETLQSWVWAWRFGMAPVLSVQHLEALRVALVNDDKRLAQGLTTTPPPLVCVSDWPVEEACPLAYCGWQGDGLGTVKDVEEFFATKCHEADQHLGSPADCRFFLNWVDQTPRDEMRAALLIEVSRSLAGRLEEEAAGDAAPTVVVDTEGPF